MQIINEVKLDFKDVLIKPKRSKTASRAAVDLQRELIFEGTPYQNKESCWKGVPIIASNMSTVGTFAMARALGKYRMMTCLHKHYSAEDLIEFFREINCESLCQFVFYTMGITNDDLGKLKKVRDAGDSCPGLICVDVANGYTEYFQDRVKRIKDICPDSVIMAGNVCTPEMVQELLISGACNIVKIGIGPGSVCTTRVKSGIGYPQLSAVIETADCAHGNGGHICSDGGCVVEGDVVKAFGAGADFVMLGGMFAGTAECDGEWIEENDKKFLKFYGMASQEAQNKYNGGVKPYCASEGKSVKVPYKGSVDDVAKEILGGLRSACAYVGANKLKDFTKCCTFIRVTQQENRVFS